MVTVVDRNGDAVTAANSPIGFPSSNRTEPPDEGPIDPKAFWKEDHHRSYGRPWLLGRVQFNALVAHGLARTDKVLDFGCGAGRCGVWLARYLEPDHYCGVDAHLRALRAFAEYECVLHQLGRKRPRLMHSEGFDLAGFGERFDVILDFFTTPHLTPEQVELAIARIASVAAPGARLISINPELDARMLDGHGFELSKSFDTDYPQLADAGVRAFDSWRVFTRTGVRC